jgi:hypothetical protein
MYDRNRNVIDKAQKDVCAKFLVCNPSCMIDSTSSWKSEERSWFVTDKHESDCFPAKENSHAAAETKMSEDHQKQEYKLQTQRIS